MAFYFYKMPEMQITLSEQISKIEDRELLNFNISTMLLARTF